MVCSLFESCCFSASFFSQIYTAAEHMHLPLMPGGGFITKQLTNHAAESHFDVICKPPRCMFQAPQAHQTQLQRCTAKARRKHTHPFCCSCALNSAFSRRVAFIPVRRSVSLPLNGHGQANTSKHQQTLLTVAKQPTPPTEIIYVLSMQAATH